MLRLRDYGETQKALVLVEEHGVPEAMILDAPEGSQAWWDGLEYLLEMELQVSGRRTRRRWRCGA